MSMDMTVTPACDPALAPERPGYCPGGCNSQQSQATWLHQRCLRFWRHNRRLDHYAPSCEAVRVDGQCRFRLPFLGPSPHCTVRAVPSGSQQHVKQRRTRVSSKTTSETQHRGKGVCVRRDAVMQWEIAAASAVVWDADQWDVRPMCGWRTNKTTREPESDAGCRCLGQRWGSQRCHQRVDFCSVSRSGIFPRCYETGRPVTRAGCPLTSPPFDATRFGIHRGASSPRLTTAMGFSGLSGTVIASHFGAMVRANGS